MTMKTDQRIRAAYESRGGPLNQLIQKHIDLLQSEEGQFRPVIDWATVNLLKKALLALRAAGDARRPQLHQHAPELLRLLASLTHGGCLKVEGDIEKAEALIDKLLAAGAPADGAGPQESERECDDSADGKHRWSDASRFLGAQTCIDCGARGVRRLTPLEARERALKAMADAEQARHEADEIEAQAANGAGTTQRTGNEVI